jgi:hypothetical protein
VRSFCCLPFPCGENYFEGVCTPEVDNLRQRLMFDKSVKTQSVQYCRDANNGRNSHFSLKPSPTPVPFSWTDTVASVKLHDAAAKVVIAEERRRSSCKGQ